MCRLSISNFDAMRKFLIKSSLFALLICIALALLEYYVRSQSINTYKYKNELILSRGNEAQVLILGNSHTYYGVNPALFPIKAFNLANVSQTLFYDNLLLRHYIQYLPDLRYVVIPISTNSLFEGLEASKADEIAPYYKMYMGIDYFSDFSHYNFEFANLSIFSDKIRNLLMKKNTLECDSLGMALDYPLASKIEHWELFYSATVANHTPKDVSQMDFNIKNLKSITDLCRVRGIKVFFITTPAWRSYYDNIKASQLTTTHSVMNTLTDSENVYYFDYLKDARFTYDDFHDVDHLDRRGADKFTKILIYDMVRTLNNSDL